MDEGPFAALLALPPGQTAALLHSGRDGPALLFHAPIETLRLETDAWRGAFARLEAFLARHADQRCIVCLGYDLRDDIEALPRRIDDEFPWPCLHAAAFARVREWPARPEVPATPATSMVPEPPAASDLHTHLSRSDYEAGVAAVVEAIRAGEIFQANLTQPFSARYEGDPRQLFRRLCDVSPAPFAAYYQTGQGEAVLCSSPEEFLRVEGDAVRTRPIKGTRPRRASPDEDRAQLAELLASAKDQAELAMIVDLLRNDLGKVAVPGSVAVGPFPEHDSFSHVHHTFATVTARLRPEVGLIDLLRATFPSGSITGAPKLRSMEILEELEVVRRGIYTGSIGWIGPGRRMHLNVAIRTMVWRDGRLRFNTGGGITADSDPAAEFDETLHKAAGILRALGTDLASSRGPGCGMMRTEE